MEQRLLFAKEQQRQLRRMLSLAVDTVCQLKVGVVTVHSLCVACFTSHGSRPPHLIEELVHDDNGSNTAASSLICTINSGLPQLVPVRDILMLVLAEVVCSEVRLSSTMVDTKVNQGILSCECWPRLQGNLQNLVCMSWSR